MSDAATKPRSLFTLGEMMVESLMEVPEFWQSFKSVKLDSEDSETWGDERVVIIVAKGARAERLAEVYEHGE